MPHDATKFQPSVEEFIRSESFTLKVLNTSLNGLYVYDVKLGKNIFINEQYARLTKYTLSDLQAMDDAQFFSLFHPEDQQRVSAHMESILHNGADVQEIQYRFKTKDGRWIWCLSRDSVITRDEDGSVSQFVGTFFDMTTQKVAEEALIRERDLLQSVLNSAGKAHLVYLDRDFNFVRVNETYADTCGYRPEEMIGKNHFVLYPGAEVEAIFRQVRDTGQSVEMHDRPFEFPDQPERGTTYWDWTLIPVKDAGGQVTGLILSLFETTARIRAEAAVQQERDRLSALVMSMQDEVWFADAQKRFILTNPAAIKQFGLATDEAVDVEKLAARIEVLRPDGSPRPIEEAPPLRALKGEVVTNEEEIIRLPATGELRHRQLNATPVKDKDGRIIGSVSVARDITERKRTEEKLKESEERFRTMADGLPLIIWVHDAKGNQQFVNQTFLEFFGTTHDQMKDGRWRLLLHPDDSQEYADEFLACTREERFFHRQVRVRNAEGAWRWIESWGRPRFTTSGEYLGHVGASADITDRKQAEEQLCRMNETLEQQVAERTALAESRTKQLQALAIELIETEERERRQFAHLLHDDLQQMLAYAKMQLQANVEDLSSKSTLNSVAALLEECIAKSRRLSYEISPAILHQAGLMECCKWLAEKMHKQFGLNVELVYQSELSLEVMPLKIFLFRAVQEFLFNIVKHSGVGSARVEVVRTEESITVTVSDKGCGFNPEIINSQWDKLGFGLLTIKERADYIGGVFRVKSAPGQGSKFTLTFPLAVAKSEQKAVIDDSVVDELNILDPNRLKSQKTGIRLLLVDDHQVMRKGLVELISGKPFIHVVGEASNGIEALEQARKLKPDVILMDISMPKMGGIEATRLIKKELPSTRVIGLTMHEDEQLFEAMRDAGADLTLSKTTSVSELTKTIMGNSEL